MMSNRCFRIANALLNHADNVMPPHRRDWSRAMRAELEHIEQNHLLQWAFGCVIAGYIERLTIMDRSSFIVSKWLLAVEASVCLFPASALWIFAMLNMGHLIKTPIIVVFALLMTIAPINLWLALRFVATQRPLHHKVHIISALLLAMYGVLQMAEIHYAAQISSLAWFQFDWGLVAMFSILPALCCWHLSLFAMDKSVMPLATR
jgi:hypothetical protein